MPGPENKEMKWSAASAALHLLSKDFDGGNNGKQFLIYIGPAVGVQKTPAAAICDAVTNLWRTPGDAVFGQNEVTNFISRPLTRYTEGLEVLEAA